MKRFVTCMCVFVAVLGVLITAAPQQPTFRGGSDVVRVFVTVIDKDGKLVTALSRDDFEVRDEGKPQPITQFDNSPQPIRLVVLLDVSTSMSGNLPLMRAGAGQLFARLGPNDVARVGTFGDDVTISPAFTRNAEELAAALPTSIAPDAPTPLWRAVERALDTFKDEKDEDDRRNVILVLTDGKDSGPISFRQRPSSQAEVIDRARREDAMIYAIGMRSRNTQSPPPPPAFGRGGLQAMMLADLPDPGLARVAEETGGGYTEIRYGQDLAAAFAGVADELHAQYLLGFGTPKRDGKVHDINVRVLNGAGKARARKNYVAPKEP
jgi:Ca-activated chloride channel homolog